MKYPEYKRALKTEHITNDWDFQLNLQGFLDKHPNLKIIETIVHKPYHVSIIYEELIPIDQ